MNLFSKSVLAGVVLAAWPLMAQVGVPGMPIASVVQQTWTTGTVGMAAGQTAQLNVLNLSPTSTTTSTGGTTTTTPTSSCTLQLAFFDTQNRLIKQSSVSVAPGVTVTLTVTKPEIPAVSAGNLRTELHGVVKTVPPPPTAATSPTILQPICSLFTTLELFDNTTGVTQLYTSDTRMENSGVLIPMLLSGPIK